VLAFDPDAGTIAFVDAKGLPGRLDLRETDVVKASKAKLTSLSSANGSDIYGVNPKGEIVRLNPNGGAIDSFQGNSLMGNPTPGSFSSTTNKQ